jgi:cysteine desulfuration protein SufE
LASAAFETIATDFSFLEDWEDRYRHIIDLGRGLEPLSEAEHAPAWKVDGCASQVWLVPDLSDGRFRFRGDSDALIVKGLIAVLHALYDGLEPAGVLAVDAARELGRLGLDQHLSAQRSNGLRARVRRIRRLNGAESEG